ncbi:hypothetical protein JGU66_06005 [Myxococcaceae bacterium JPH2]|nr:hypothetical protein [Myxococcaceae bacterium JPH2]
MSAVKTFLNFIFGFALLGIFVASLMAPSFLEWYNSTPLATQTMCNLPQVVREVTHELMRYQIIGASVGAGVGLILGILLAVRARRVARRDDAATPPPASAA